MDKALYVAMTGARATLQAQGTVSHNLANADTAGFKAALANTEAFRIQGGTHASRIDAMHVDQGFDSRMGGQRVTGNALDVAVNGRGFFEVMLPDGTPAYTRDGSFQISAQGELVTSSGFPVQPGIQVPEGAQSVTIGKDGTVSVQVAGEPQALEIGSLTVTDFINPAGLQARGENLYLETTASGPAQNGTPGLNGLGALQQGALDAATRVFRGDDIGSFSDAELSPWVKRLRELTGADAAGARPAYVYFNNDNHGHAAFNALTLRRMAETEA